MRTVLLPALLLAACSASSAQRPASPPPRLAGDPPAAVESPAVGGEDDAVRLAVFRHLVSHYAHHAPAEQARVPFVCLQIYHGSHARDPSPFIMAAMSKEPLRIVPGSACVSRVDGVFLKGDHARGRGIVLRTAEVKIDGDKAMVSGGHYEDGLSASGRVFTVERQSDGSWQVTTTQMQWIS